MLRRNCALGETKDKRSTPVIFSGEYLAHKCVIVADVPWNPPLEACEKSAAHMTKPCRNASPPKLKLG